VESSQRRIPVRLVVALSVAAVLAVFLLYTSFAGGATESLRPSQLLTGSYADKEVQLAGIVKGPITGDEHAGGKHFTLKDFDGPQTVKVVYTGSVPDLFQAGRHVYLRGTFTDGTFVGVEDSLVTKCPSKYAPKQPGDPA
jgi:cytochrome c-type biogenesis protein CcmE